MLEEKLLWRASYLKNGPNWKAIAADVKTKNAHQCSVRSANVKASLLNNPHLDPVLLKMLL